MANNYVDINQEHTWTTSNQWMTNTNNYNLGTNVYWALAISLYKPHILNTKFSSVLKCAYYSLLACDIKFRRWRIMTSKHAIGTVSFWVTSSSVVIVAENQNKCVLGSGYPGKFSVTAEIIVLKIAWAWWELLGRVLILRFYIPIATSIIGHWHYSMWGNGVHLLWTQNLQSKSRVPCSKFDSMQIIIINSWCAWIRHLVCCLFVFCVSTYAASWLYAKINK